MDLSDDFCDPADSPGPDIDHRHHEVESHVKIPAIVEDLLVRVGHAQRPCMIHA